MAMHQPNYLPWIGYFNKISCCDIFVYLDSVQFPRGQNFSSRTKIKAASGPVYLSIPISKPKGIEGKASYYDITFANSNWKNKHLKSIYFNYKKTPFFSEIYAIIEEKILKAQNIVDLNINLIESIIEYLNIRNQRVKLSDIAKKFGKKNDLIVDICKKVDANIYLSGTGGGKKYNDEVLLNISNIDLKYLDFKHPKYPQIWNEFVSGLSIVDLLFNCGPESRNYIL
ncbi:MAG: WbqC family protein [bacterium]